MHPSILQYSITPPLQFVARWGDARESNQAYETFSNPLDSLAHPSLGSLDRRAVPFEGLFDFSGKRRFAGGHIVNEFFFGGDLHARVVFFSSPSVETASR